MESIKLKELEELVARQNEELKAAIPNPQTQSTVRQLLRGVLFSGLSSNELRLLIKFLIESIEESEKSAKKVVADLLW